MPQCSFCSKQISRGAGKMFVRKDGRVLYFCSSKCEHNMLDLRRRARSTAWTADAQKAKQERLAQKK